MQLYIYVSTHALDIIFLIRWMTSKVPVVAVRVMLFNEIVECYTHIKMVIHLFICLFIQSSDLYGVLFCRHCASDGDIMIC